MIRRLLIGLFFVIGPCLLLFALLRAFFAMVGPGPLLAWLQGLL